MKQLAFLILFINAVCGVPYHPRQEYRIDVNSTSEIQFYTINAPNLFSETILHQEVILCIENQLSPSTTVQLLDNFKENHPTLNLNQKLTAVGRHLITNWDLVIKYGLNITVAINSSRTKTEGFLIFKRCRKDFFTTVDHNITSVLRSFQSWDYSLHVPFHISRNENATKYVDFSTILPRRVLDGNNWQLNGFCINATIGGNVKVHMSRCKYSKPFTIEISATKERQIVRYWSDFISLSEKCPIEEETLTDHLWVDIESIAHHGLGELVIYNCIHTWVKNSNGEEEIQIAPDMRKLESTAWAFDYVVLPNRQNVHFAPIKHMIDTALITDAEIQFSFTYDVPHMISFSSCYNSEKYFIEIPETKTIFNFTRKDMEVLSSYSNVLDCPEDKTHHGVYMNIGADGKKITGIAFLQLIGTSGVQTPEGKLRNDAQTTVAFNISRGDWISKNVNIQSLMRQAKGNIHVELNQMFNCTGLVQLYISRCEFSPKLKLFGPMKMGSATFGEKTIDYIFDLFDKTDCISDFQDKRYEYRTNDKHGLYFHIEALEDSIGYTAIYESFKAKLIYHELTEPYVQGSHENTFHSYFRVFKAEVGVEVPITHLIDRAKIQPPVSLRLYVSSSAPLEFAFSQCKYETKKDWKKLGSTMNESISAWYTFDNEGVDLLRGYTNSQNCQLKPHPMLFLHVKAEKRITVHFEFSVVKGTDLNVVNSCPIAEKLRLQELEFQNHVLMILVHIASIVIIILSVSAVWFVIKTIQRTNAKVVTQFEMAPLEQMMTGSTYVEFK